MIVRAEISRAVVILPETACRPLIECDCPQSSDFVWLQRSDDKLIVMLGARHRDSFPS